MVVVPPAAAPVRRISGGGGHAQLGIFCVPIYYGGATIETAIADRFSHHSADTIEHRCTFCQLNQSILKILHKNLYLLQMNLVLQEKHL